MSWVTVSWVATALSSAVEVQRRGGPAPGDAGTSTRRWPARPCALPRRPGSAVPSVPADAGSRPAATDRRRCRAGRARRRPSTAGHTATPAPASKSDSPCRACSRSAAARICGGIEGRRSPRDTCRRTSPPGTTHHGARPGTRTRSRPGSAPGTSPARPDRPSPRPIHPSPHHNTVAPPRLRRGRTTEIFSGLLGRAHASARLRRHSRRLRCSRALLGLWRGRFRL